jgi:hypothetical protein
MTTTNPAHRLLVAAALAGLGLTVAACSGGNSAQAPATETVTVGAEADSAGDPSAEPAADDPAQDPAEDSGASDHVGSQLPADWPDQEFPIPPGVTVQVAGEDANEKGIILTGASPDEVATFYRSALPAAGYQITDDDSVSVGGAQIVGLNFSGNGYTGELAVVNGRVIVSLQEQ